MKRRILAPRALLLAVAFPAAAVTAAVDPVSAGAAGPAFESHWQDGRAEVSGYRYRVTRYGQERTGQAVLIFVTEPFSELRHVKVDNPQRKPGDTFEALKLNLVRDFQTGIYDYNTMVSVFTKSRDFSVAKISFSAGEWCGHVYEETDFEPHRITNRLTSYFEGESARRTLQKKREGVAEDQLFILLRGLRGAAYLEPGLKREVPFLAGALFRRLGHRHIGWGTAGIERLANREMAQVPAGRYECDVYAVRPSDGREGRFWIERAPPHRVIRWAWTLPGTTDRRAAADGCDTGELTGSMRLPYWQLNANGNETYLRELGLSPGAPVPPGAGKGRATP